MTRWARRFGRELSVAATYAALLLVLAWFRPAFFGPANLRSLVVSLAPVLVASVGMTLVIQSNKPVNRTKFGVSRPRKLCRRVRD